MAELTERLLRARKSHPMGTLHSISLHVLADEALAFAKSHPDVRNCKIQVHCPASIELTGYPDLLRQALFNLLLNAAQATAGRGSIFLEVSRDQDHIRLVVADDGPGIPEADREKIFEPFYTTKPQGTGLGMLSIQACVESHHGEIVVGESIQGGAQFTLRFPIIGT
ncbi:MAG: ATP-binding protein [Calditrichota bacterium]